MMMMIPTKSPIHRQSAHPGVESKDTPTFAAALKLQQYKRFLLSTDGRAVGLCWAQLNPKGPKKSCDFGDEDWKHARRPREDRAHQRAGSGEEPRYSLLSRIPDSCWLGGFPTVGSYRPKQIFLFLRATPSSCYELMLGGGSLGSGRKLGEGTHEPF